MGTVGSMSRLTLPRVFISSVIDDFGQLREAAAAGIEDAGAEPIMIERLPSLAQSSRNVCLDGVQTSDACAVIVGHRGGWVTPSGRLAIEEEFEEAQRRTLPILFFLQDVDRDENAERLAKRLSEYVSGRFRTKFSGPEDLREKVAAAVRRMGETLRIPLADSNRVRILLETDARHRTSYEASVRLALVPERSDELIAPERMGSDDLVRNIYAIGHDAAVRFFDYSCSKGHESSPEGALVITQEAQKRGDGRTRVRMSEQGEVVFESELVSSLEPGSTVVSSVIILEADLAAALEKEFAFAARLFDYLDPHERLGVLWMGAAVLGAGSRYLFTSPPRGGVPIRMGDDDPLIAEQAPRKTARAVLRSPQAEIQRLLARFRGLLGPPRNS